jgi:hypothetical protein
VARLICKELPLGSLLALRETCKTTRELVDIDNKTALTEALKEINIELPTLRDLGRFIIESCFSCFSLQIHSIEYYGNREVTHSMQRVGHIIRRLTVSSFWKCASDAE